MEDLINEFASRIPLYDQRFRWGKLCPEYIVGILHSYFAVSLTPTEFFRAVQICIVTEHAHPRDRGPAHTDGQHIQMAHTKGIPNNKGLHVSPRILCISLQGVKLHLNASEYWKNRVCQYCILGSFLQTLVEITSLTSSSTRRGTQLNQNASFR